MKKFDVKQDVVDRIIERFETVGEFEMPFKTFGTMNFKSKKLYRGINILLLAMAGYSSPYWGSPKQWIEAGANIKGAKCTRIVFWNIKKVEDDDGEEKTIAWAKYHNVLNSEQVTGWVAPSTKKKDETEIVALADEFLGSLGVNVTVKSGRAFYSIGEDYINMPPRKDFFATKTSTATEAYYSTYAHESVHATMHKERCDRNMKSYAAEELVAEIGAAMLCERLGISSEMRDDHVAYIKSWLENLRNDKQFIFSAAKQAQTAIDWMAEKQGGVKLAA